MNEQVKKSKMNKQTNDKKAAVNQNELTKMLISNLMVWWRNKSSIPKKEGHIRKLCAGYDNCNNWLLL